MCPNIGRERFSRWMSFSVSSMTVEREETGTHLFFFDFRCYGWLELVMVVGLLLYGPLSLTRRETEEKPVRRVCKIQQ